MTDEHDRKSSMKNWFTDFTVPNSLFINGIVFNFPSNSSCYRREIGKDISRVSNARSISISIYSTYQTLNLCPFMNIHLLKDFEKYQSYSMKGLGLEKESNFDPRQFNLTEDFIYVDKNWGSLFYKHLGKMSKKEARNICAQYGDFVHLPIPRFDDENKFYQEVFADEGLWLDISYDDKTAVLTTDSGQVFERQIETVTGIERIKYFDWMIFNQSEFTEVFLSGNGQWRTADEKQLFNSVCVYNIVPDQKCSKCFDEKFCRYKDSTRKTTECVCPVGRGGEDCQLHYCSLCQNDNYCSHTDTSTQLECVCRFPYFGPTCESLSKCEFFFFNSCSFLYFLEYRILVLNTFSLENKPMILEDSGEWYLIMNQIYSFGQ